MNYRPRNNRGSRYATAMKVVGGVLAVLIILSFIAPQALSGFFSKIFSPFWRLSGTFYSSENMALTQQIEAHSADAAALATLEQENAELKTMLGRAPTKNAILAVVLKKPPFSPYDSIIIDIGADHAVAVGDMVYAITADAIAPMNSSPVSTIVTAATSTSTATSSPAATSSPSASVVKIPVGLVTEVDSATSKVDLFSSPGRKYNVEIGKNHIAVTATGRGAGAFEATLPRESNIAVGDVVTIPSIEPITFATVTGIISDAVRPFATVIFQSPVNIFTLHWVEVDSKK